MYDDKEKKEESLSENEEDEQSIAELEAERIEILDGLAKKVEDLFQKRANQRVVKDGEWDSCLKLYHAPLVDGDSYYSDRPSERTNPSKRPTPNFVRTKANKPGPTPVPIKFAGEKRNRNLLPPPKTTD